MQFLFKFFLSDKLWVAPELLCMDERDVPDYGTKDGDVYAYGIILQEIVCKNSPYTIERETMRTKGSFAFFYIPTLNVFVL